MILLPIHTLYLILSNTPLVSRQTLPYAQYDGSFPGLFRSILFGFLTIYSVHMLILKWQGTDGA